MMTVTRKFPSFNGDNFWIVGNIFRPVRVPPQIRKAYFPLGIGFILIQQLVLLILLYNMYLTK